MARALEVGCVEPWRAAEVWGTVGYWIRRAVMKGGGTTDFGIIQKQVLNGDALLWLTWRGSRIKAAAVTQLGISNGKKFVTIVACGGDQNNPWRESIGPIEDYARAEGCQSVVIHGRKGWLRVLDGYRQVATTIERTL